MAALLDVNVLVALAWPAHVHHEPAHAWFERNHKSGWATCPSTQAGFIRVVSNPAFSRDALTPRAAFDQLERMIGQPGHRFWADDTTLVGSRFLASEKLVGHRQVTDAHLLAIALRHRGALATLDRAARSVVPPAFPPEVVQVLTEG